MACSQRASRTAKSGRLAAGAPAAPRRGRRLRRSRWRLCRAALWAVSRRRRRRLGSRPLRATTWTPTTPRAAGLGWAPRRAPQTRARVWASALASASSPAPRRCASCVCFSVVYADFASRRAQEDEEDDALPTAFGQRLKEAAEARRREADAKARREAQGGAAAGAGRARGGASARQPHAAAPLAAFEAHTRGIGSKLLEKMGYKAGQGLGRDGTGIAEAIQTKLRPKNMGMGYNEYQEQARVPADADVAEPEAPSRAAPGAAAPAPAKGGWKRRAKEARQKRVYKTAEELLRESEVRSLIAAVACSSRVTHAPSACAGGRPSHDGGGHARNSCEVRSVPCRLRRARRTLTRKRRSFHRVVTNLERVSEAPTTADAAVAENLIDATPMPELQHNLRLIVDLAEAEIQVRRAPHAAEFYLFRVLMRPARRRWTASFARRRTRTPSCFARPLGCAQRWSPTASA